MSVTDLLPPQLQPHLPLVAIVATASSLALLCLLLLLLIYSHGLRRLLQRQRRNLARREETIGELQEKLEESRIRAATLSTRLENERRSGSEKLDLLEEARENLRLQFQSLAQQIFEEKSRTSARENKERLQTVLQPFAEQLHAFRKRIDDIQVNDVRERASLKEELVHLRSLNARITEEAANLTRALRGDRKQQGDWGEVVLERLLERSGLRRDAEYTVQTGLRGRDGRLRRPDVIIRLPEGRDIIVDSKVSLSAWERYTASDEEGEQQRHLLDHAANIRRHVSELSEKSYSDLKGLNCLDFVFLFMPIDASFTAACEVDEGLFTDAYDRRVIIVTPTTLLATLKTVDNLWRFDRQNRNAREIAARAGAMYDKLRGFLEEMEKIGRQLALCSTTYEAAMDKLARGRGNVVSQAERLTGLGVKVKKKIPASIASGSDDESGD